ncbi:HNH endonuclease [Streptomyces lateritius]|uniref:HNH endonuclease n=1 Tax=Streptomyces lateritius TaxID=67313 RepID=UPI0037D9B413
MNVRPYVCGDCGKTGEQLGRGRPRKRCDACRDDWTARKERLPRAICEACDTTFGRHHRGQRWCSQSCAGPNKPGAGPRGRSPESLERQRLYWQAKNRRRRAAKRGGRSEPYTLEEIAARDRGRCRLCGGRVAMRQKVPHVKAPTIDHIVPVSEGGDDTRANVQLAHFGCNSSKGARGSQQLALIG